MFSFTTPPFRLFPVYLSFYFIPSLLSSSFSHTVSSISRSFHVFSLYSFPFLPSHFLFPLNPLPYPYLYFFLLPTFLSSTHGLLYITFLYFPGFISSPFQVSSSSFATTSSFSSVTTLFISPYLVNFPLLISFIHIPPVLPQF